MEEDPGHGDGISFIGGQCVGSADNPRNDDRTQKMLSDTLLHLLERHDSEFVTTDTVLVLQNVHSSLLSAFDTAR